MSQSYLWPAGLAGGAASSNPANGTPGSAAPSTATEVAGVDGGGILRALSVDTSGNLNVNVLSLTPVTGTVTANQGTAAAIGSAWPVKLTDGTNTNTFTGTSLNVNVTASALPSGAATSALQTTGNTSLATIATNSSATQGTVAAGTAATKSDLIGGVFNTVLPTLTNGQQAALQVDSSGRQILAPLTNTSVVKAQLQDNAGTAVVLGQTTMSASLPVAIASDQSALSITDSTTDLYVTGQSAQTATVNNILTAASGAAATDLLGYRSGTVQVVSTGTGGTFIFEGSNDNSNFQAIPVWNQLILTGTPITAAVTASSSQFIYTFPVAFRYVRLRIASTITGGSIQAFSKFSKAAFAPGIQQVAQATAANLNVTVTGTVTANGGTSPSLANAWNIKVTDGTNTAAVKAASTAPAAADPAVVVAISPNSTTPKSTGRTSANAPARNDYTSVNVTTGAYVQLVASTTSATNLVEVFDSSGQTLAFATGAAASEVIQFYITPGGNGQVPLAIPAGTRVAIKAISATASVGEIDVNFYT